MKAIEPETTFLNVDLEIESNTTLQPLIDWLGEDIRVQYYGEKENAKFFASVSLADSMDKDMDSVINDFCNLIENLSVEAKDAWDKAILRKFDAGFECGSSQRRYQTEIRADTIRRIEQIGASFGLTIYPEDKNL